MQIKDSSPRFLEILILENMNDERHLHSKFLEHVVVFRNLVRGVNGNGGVNLGLLLLRWFIWI